MDMQKHIRELKLMRRICREKDITETSLAKRFGWTDQEVFDILEGRTKEGAKRDQLFAFLNSDFDAASGQEYVPAAPVQGAPAFVEVAPDPSLYKAWKALGISQGDFAKRFNRSPGLINTVLKGHVTSGALYEAVRAHLLDGKEALALPPSHTRIVSRNAPPLPVRGEQPIVPVAIPVAPVVVTLPAAVVVLDGERLLAQAMAAEELAAALRDLAVLRQAESRYATALKLCTAAGVTLTFTQP